MGGSPIRETLFTFSLITFLYFNTPTLARVNSSPRFVYILLYTQEHARGINQNRKKKLILHDLFLPLYKHHVSKGPSQHLQTNSRKRLACDHGDYHDEQHKGFMLCTSDCFVYLAVLALSCIRGPYR